MKPEELQLGDIVATTPSGMPIKVASIHRKKVAYHACTDRFSWVRIGLLRPIPLTPEILEKNFPDVETGVTWSETSSKGLFNIRVEYDKYVEGIFNYIHELQHALKLCGINKEIEI